MTVSVLIPHGGDCEWRARALEWTSDRYRGLGWEVVVGEHDSDPWCKPAAVAEAFHQSTGDVLVVADGDCWAEEIEQAVGSVVDGAPWAVPFKQVQRLNERSTEEVYGGAEFSLRLRRSRPAYRGHLGGGIVVLPRVLCLEVPLDLRFVGWGGEDEAWGCALQTLAGEPWRSRRRLWHLWHPPSEQRAKRGERDLNGELKERYDLARGDPDRMRALLAEGAAWTSRSSFRGPATAPTASGRGNGSEGT